MKFYVFRELRNSNGFSEINEILMGSGKDRFKNINLSFNVFRINKLKGNGQDVIPNTFLGHKPVNHINALVGISLEPMAVLGT